MNENKKLVKKGKKKNQMKMKNIKVLKQFRQHSLHFYKYEF